MRIAPDALCVAALAALAAAAPPAHADRLTDAYRRGDPAALAAAGAAAGARGIEADLGAPSRVVALAAIAAAPHAKDAWFLLSPLADLAAGPDRPRAAAAARAAAEIATSLTRIRLSDLDVPAALVRDRIARWRDLALAPGRWPDVRVCAIEVATALVAALGPDAHPADYPADVPMLVADPEPEVRRATVELMPQPLSPRDRKLASARVVEDQDDAVAVAAAQAVCGGLASGDSPATALAALGAAGIARIRRLVVTRSLPPVERLDAALCLVADHAPASMAAVRRFRARASPPLRRALKHRARPLR